ncbi:hypothetical protein ACKVWM_011437 [Pyricularia oryzae]
MAQKVWIFPPDFTFRPSGELALGTVIKHPRHPTLALASLRSNEHPEIVLPEIDTLHESSHVHSHSSKRSGELNALAKLADLASASTSAGLSLIKEWSLGSVDLEVQTFSNALSKNALKAITRLEPVRKHINSGIFGKKPVYIISGLRVAKTSFQVMDQIRSTASMSIGASGPAPAWVLPVEIGGGISGSCEKNRSDSYATAPGIVYAYRVHVIRAKRDGEEAELFSYRGAFDTSESEESEGEEVECTEATASMLKEDEETKVAIEEYPLQEAS